VKLLKMNTDNFVWTKLPGAILDERSSPGRRARRVKTMEKVRQDVERLASSPGMGEGRATQEQLPRATVFIRGSLRTGFKRGKGREKINRDG